MPGGSRASAALGSAAEALAVLEHAWQVQVDELGFAAPHDDYTTFYDDAYQTWYMYGAAMFLHFLRERHDSADPGFIARAWRRMCSGPGNGRPDYDAHGPLTLRRGVSECFCPHVQVIDSRNLMRQ